MSPTPTPRTPPLVRFALAFAAAAGAASCAVPRAKEPPPPGQAFEGQQSTPAPMPQVPAQGESRGPQGGYPGAQAGTPPPAPPPRPAPEPQSEARPNAPVSPAQTGPAQSPGAVDAGKGRGASLARAGTDLEAAQRELDRGGRDCATACRALGSMDRAVGRLCELARANEETRRCEDARLKLFSARERVRNMCGSCAGGPSVEAGAPVPSIK
jgi:hypothetical protein